MNFTVSTPEPRTLALLGLVGAPLVAGVVRPRIGAGRRKGGVDGRGIGVDGPAVVVVACAV